MGERSRRLLAVSYRNAGRYREAALAYRDLLREEPASGELLVGLAYCLDSEGQADYALALLEKAPKAAKAGADPWILQAALYARAGKNEAAVQALRAAIERDRGNETAWRNLVALYRKQGLSELAANCEEEARAALWPRARPPRPRPRPAKAAARPGRRRQVRRWPDGSRERQASPTSISAADARARAIG